MDDDWDLHAVVRGCAAVNTTDDTFSNSPSLPINNIENSFDFPCFFDNKNDPFLGLHEIYQEFCVDSPPPAAAISAVASPVAQGFQPHDQIPQTQPLRQMNKQRQEKNTSFPSPLSYTATNSQPFRQRRRRNQQTKMIREMTQEELAGDSWAWRKYGQKPIKGSPYPRNYYRCSTSKDCAARKQVERSVNDPTIFVVSYTGEHTHPRPIHRSSLAGSTRNRLGQNKNNNNTLCSLSIMGSLSSPASCSSFSSTTIGGEATEQNDDVEMEQEVEEENNERDYEEEDDNNNIMMINDLMNNDEDIFKRFQDSDDSKERDLFTSDVLLSPPWLSPENRDT